MLSSASFLVNDPSKKGQRACRAESFGDFGRYRVYAIHTRFDAVEWFVADAEHPLSDLRHAEIIRQCATKEEALRGLV